MEQLLERINKIKSDEHYNKGIMYLLEDFNDKSGVFYHSGKVLFAELSHKGNKSSRIDTVSLTLMTNVNINSLYEHQRFKNGFYNLIYFNGGLDDVNLSTFTRLSRLYSINSEKSFVDFFNSLISIFQLYSDKKDLDSIGLIGELFFIKEVHDKFQIDISKYWHIDGNNSKYDFSLDNANLEIKTTIKEQNSFHIKHSQIFNGDNNFLILVKISKGKFKFRDLIDFFIYTSPFSQNFGFQIRLQESINNLEKTQFEKSYDKNKIYIFNTFDLNTIKNIPEEINNLTYDYTFDLNQSKPFNDLKIILGNKG